MTTVLLVIHIMVAAALIAVLVLVFIRRLQQTAPAPVTS